MVGPLSRGVLTWALRTLALVPRTISTRRSSTTLTAVWCGRRADAGGHEVLQPCSGIKLAVDGVNQPRILATGWSLFDFYRDETDDRLCLVACGLVDSIGCLPSYMNGVACIPLLQLEEVDGRLLALSSFELFTTAESWRQQGQTDGCRALGASIDESIDALGVVVKVRCQDGVGQVRRVGGEKFAELVCNQRCFVVCHASAIAL